MKVLLIEDEFLIALDLETHMKESGMEVVRAANGEQGVACALAELPDVIVLDIGLPDISGLDALDEIQAAGLNVPTIVLTGMHSRETKREAREHGVVAYLEKPFDPRVLIARIHIVCPPLNRRIA